MESGYGLDGIRNLDPSVHWPIYNYLVYFDTIISVLESQGWLHGKTLFGVPWDWRQSMCWPPTLKVGSPPPSLPPSSLTQFHTYMTFEDMLAVLKIISPSSPCRHIHLLLSISSLFSPLSCHSLSSLLSHHPWYLLCRHLRRKSDVHRIQTAVER